MGRKIFNFFRIWGNLVLITINVYPFVLTYLIPSPDGIRTGLFGWSWWWWLIIFLISIILTLLIQNWINQNEKVENQKYGEAPILLVTGRGNTFKDVTVERNVTKDSNNTNIGTLNIGSEDRIKKDLRLQIGIELQAFSRAFHDIGYANLRDLRRTYDKADKMFEKITSDLFYRANLLLTETWIPSHLVDLKKYYSEYTNYLFWHNSIEVDIQRHIISGSSMAKKRSKVPPELDEEEKNLRISLETNQIMVQKIIGEILKLCKE